MNAGESTTQAVDYDYDSIMHYDAYAFSSNDLPTIEPRDSSVALDRLGQRNRLSERDKEHIKILYPMSERIIRTCDQRPVMIDHLVGSFCY